eukprot:TRINITY_DN26_c0_g4_i1.p1 TRINITY_DN26_c0_g4~~TRINITY_DN26_c0_g4_i1.p1  ORF type:complete len:368 (-),score=105.13 TRINITY_DN26_c0_g4_i1:89-1111(-)
MDDSPFDFSFAQEHEGGGVDTDGERCDLEKQLESARAEAASYSCRLEALEVESVALISSLQSRVRTLGQSLDKEQDQNERLMSGMRDLLRSLETIQRNMEDALNAMDSRKPIVTPSSSSPSPSPSLSSTTTMEIRQLVSDLKRTLMSWRTSMFMDPLKDGDLLLPLEDVPSRKIRKVMNTDEQRTLGTKMDREAPTLSVCTKKEVVQPSISMDGAKEGIIDGVSEGCDDPMDLSMANDIYGLLQDKMRSGQLNVEGISKKGMHLLDSILMSVCASVAGEAQKKLHGRQRGTEDIEMSDADIIESIQKILPGPISAEAINLANHILCSNPTDHGAEEEEEE